MTQTSFSFQKNVNRHTRLSLPEEIIIGTITAIDELGQPRVDFTGEDIEIDGGRVLRAEEEFVFECGESSLTLTKSGKIIIGGKHLINHATGINWIMGGAIRNRSDPSCCHHLCVKK